MITLAIFLLITGLLFRFFITNGGKHWFHIPLLGSFSISVFMLVVPTIVLSIIFLLITFSDSYRVERFQAWLNPYTDPYGRGYVAITIRNILSCSKFFGKGTLPENFIESKSILLPNMQYDYVITYLIHSIGWVAFIFILLIFMAFILRGFYLCSKQKSILGRLVSTSVLLTFTIQAVVYIMANLGFQLFTPLAFPLISYGGGSTVINLILIGIMLSVFKSGYLVRDTQKPVISNNKIFEFIDGKIIIDFKMLPLFHTKRIL